MNAYEWNWTLMVKLIYLCINLYVMLIFHCCMPEIYMLQIGVTSTKKKKKPNVKVLPMGLNFDTEHWKQ